MKVKANYENVPVTEGNKPVMKVKATFDNIDVQEVQNDFTVKILMVKGEKGDTGDAGDYTTLSNKPKINGVELSGNKTATQLKLANASDITSLGESVAGLAEEVSDLQGDLEQTNQDLGDLSTAVSNKVDKVSGKGLSTNDYTTEEKEKLASIEAGSGKITVDSAMSSTSTNPVQNKVVNTELGKKVDKVTGKGLSSNDYTDDEKTKLSGIATGANKTTVDSAMSSTSTNPVQNKVVNTELGKKADTASPTFTGTPKAPTATAGTNTTQIATTAYVKTEIMNMVYPVGSIYMSVNSTSPATFFGGTWERLKDRFLLGCGDTYSNGATGGATTHNHSYCVDYRGFHGEVVNKGAESGGIHVYDYSTSKYATATADGTESTWVNSALNGGEKEATVNKYYSEGKTSSGSNLPPYLAVYIWKRTK